MEINILSIRPEKTADFEAIRNLVANSFLSAEHTDGNEHNLIDRIRETDDYIPELSLVAERDGHIVGYVMMSRVYVGNKVALALAPLAVLPELQGQSIGSQLIKEAHKLASALGYGYSIVLGDPKYYSRFGYVTAFSYGIKAPFDVPNEYYMVCKFSDDVCIPSGIVEYSKAFGL